MAEEEYKFERRGLGEKNFERAVLRDEGEVRAEVSVLSALSWEVSKVQMSFLFRQEGCCSPVSITQKLSFRYQAPFLLEVSFGDGSACLKTAQTEKGFRNLSLGTTCLTYLLRFCKIVLFSKYEQLYV